MNVATNKPLAPSGWTLDGDGWYVRAMRPSDLRIDTVAAQRQARHFGFTFGGVVFVLQVKHCHDYDRGVVTPDLREAVR